MKHLDERREARKIKRMKKALWITVFLSVICVSATAQENLLQIKCRLATDQYSNLRLHEEQARLDNFFFIINRDRAQGLVIINYKRSDSGSLTIKRLSRIINHANFRHFDLHRLTFMLIDDTDSQTMLRALNPSDKIEDFVYGTGKPRVIKGEQIKQNLNRLFPGK
jgi:hypothetical protein